MQCPTCRSSLQAIEYEGVRVETCPSCGGEWLDSDELGKIVDLRARKFDEAERRALAAAATIKGVVLKDVDRDLRCPACAGTTDPINYGGDTGIIIDRCTACRGFWLDGRELEKIQKLVEGWEDNLPQDLWQYKPKLRKVAQELDRKDNVRISRVWFINVLINECLDMTMRT